MNSGSGDDTVESAENVFHHRFDVPEELSLRFDAPERDEWQKPEQVIESFQLTGDATVAEIGSGTGYFAIRLGKYLEKGKVIGLDAEPKMVEYLKNRAERLGMAHVEARLIDSRGKVNVQEKVDLVFSVDTYHHIRDRVAYFSQCRQYLKVGGKLVVIDRPASSSPEGSQAKPRIAPETVKHELQKAGFTPVKDFDFLPYQYYLVFEATEADKASA